MSEMSDDRIIARMRSALDELATGVDAADDDTVVSLRPAALRPARRRSAWPRTAAVGVLLAGGSVWALSTRSLDPVASQDDVPVATDATALAATTLPGGSTPTTASGRPAYTLISARLAPGEPVVEEVPDTGDGLHQVWRVEGEGLDGFLMANVLPESPFAAGALSSFAVTELPGVPDGTARLIVSEDAPPDLPADPVVEWVRTDGAVWVFSQTGLVRPGADDTWLDLVRSAVPGSGLPIVLPDERATALGVSGDPTTFVRQEYTGVDGGMVSYLLVDSLVSFGGLNGVIGVEPTTVAGRPGWRVAIDGEAVTAIWDAGDGWYGQLTILSPLSADADDIIAAVVRTDTAPTASPAPAPDTAPATEQLYRTTAGIIQTGDGPPMIAYGARLSNPPQGGAIELAGLDWSDVPDAQTLNDTTWSGTYDLVGTFDGTVFTLTEPPSPPTGSVGPVVSAQMLTAGCTDDDVEPVLEALRAIDLEALGVFMIGDDRWDGRCGAFVWASVDTPELRAALAPLGDQVSVEFAITAL